MTNDVTNDIITVVIGVTVTVLSVIERDTRLIYADMGLHIAPTTMLKWFPGTLSVFFRDCETSKSSVLRKIGIPQPRTKPMTAALQRRKHETGIAYQVWIKMNQY